MSEERNDDKAVYAHNKIYESHVLEPDEEPPGPLTKQLMDYWNDKRGDRPYPLWQEIDLMELYRVADMLIVKDVIDGGADFLNRFWGSGMTRSTGFDGTGRLHTEIYATQPEGPQVYSYHLVLDQSLPVVVHRDSTFISGREFITYHALHLPVGNAETSTITHLLSVHEISLS